jgi:hypothetical protein
VGEKVIWLKMKESGAWKGFCVSEKVISFRVKTGGAWEGVLGD